MNFVIPVQVYLNTLRFENKILLNKILIDLRYKIFFLDLLDTHFVLKEKNIHFIAIFCNEAITTYSFILLERLLHLFKNTKQYFSKKVQYLFFLEKIIVNLNWIKSFKITQSFHTEIKSDLLRSWIVSIFRHYKSSVIIFQYNNLSNNFICSNNIINNIVMSYYSI